MENDEYIFVGKKRLKKAPGQVEIAASGAWTLYRMQLSSCRRFQNYRLYLDAKGSRKSVWFLGTYAHNGELVKGRELEILDTYYEGMVDWFNSAIRGVVLEAPVNESNGARFEKRGLPMSEDVVGKMLDILDRAWGDGRPLSYFAHTEGTGRYAVEEIASALKLSKTRVKAMLKSLCADGVIATTMFNKNKKTKGLKSARLVEREKWWAAKWQGSGLAERQDGEQVDGGAGNGNG